MKEKAYYELHWCTTRKHNQIHSFDTEEEVRNFIRKKLPPTVHTWSIELVLGKTRTMIDRYSKQNLNN